MPYLFSLARPLPHPLAFPPSETALGDALDRRSRKESYWRTPLWCGRFLVSQESDASLPHPRRRRGATFYLGLSCRSACEGDTWVTRR